MALSFSKLIKNTHHYVSLVLIFLFPFFFLPITANFFETNKLMLLIVVCGLLLLSWAVSIIATKKINLVSTPLTLPILLIGVSVLVSTFLGSQTPTETLFGLGLFIPSLVVFSIILTNTINNPRFINHAALAVVASSTLLSILSIFQSLGFGLSTILNRLMGTTIPDTLAFTPAGSPLALIVLLVAGVLSAVFMAFTARETLEKVALFLTSAVIASGLVLLGAYSMPGKDTAPVFLPPRIGYSIAIETLKNTNTALVGYGPESFTEAYNKTRPAAINLTPLWNIRFTNSSNELFTIITTLGVLGLAAWIWLTATLLKNIRLSKRDTSTSQGSLIKLVTLSLLFLFILLPATYIHYFILFVFLTLWALYIKFHQPAQVSVADLSLKGISLVRPDNAGHAKESQLVILPFLVSLPFIGLTLFVWWYFFRLYNAEVTFKRSLDAAARNEGVPTYDLQRTAITQNPYFSRYRRAYAATNLALANSLAGKENLTDEDRQNITQLIQQAIREGKAAVAIDTQNAANWENLAGIYRALIGVAQNADAWTLASLAQAIQTDPVNPRLRLDLGGVYYAIGQYDQSIRLYQQATELKPDWANAYYNLSASYRQKDDNQQAYDYLRRTLELVQPDSADYAKAQEELTTLAEELNVEESQAPAPPQTELNAPSIAPTQPPENQVELPDNSGPQNIDNLTPAPTESPDQTPAPSPTP